MIVLAAGIVVPFLWLIPLVALLWWWRRRRKPTDDVMVVDVSPTDDQDDLDDYELVDDDLGASPD